MGIKISAGVCGVILICANIGLAGLHRDPLPGEPQKEPAATAVAPTTVPPTETTPEEVQPAQVPPTEIPTPNPVDVTAQAAIDDNTLMLLTADATALASTEKANATSVKPLAAAHHNPVSTFLAGGISDGTVKAITIGADYHFEPQWALGDQGRLSSFSEFILGYWEGKEGHTGVTSLHEIGASMLVRYRYLRNNESTLRPFVDLGLGLHYLTETRIEGKELGRHWQAGSNIGIGLLFGSDERIEAGVRIRHLSNAGTDAENWGVNQILARLAIRL